MSDNECDGRGPRPQVRDRPWPFEVTRLSERTLVIVEIDRFGERPHIYVVCGARKAVVIDTGCGTDSLSEFLDTLPALDGLDTLVINTHVHYDHIMGNHGFCRPRPGGGAPQLRGRCRGLCQGSRNRRFSEGWRETSLQRTVGASVEDFCVTSWLEEGQRIFLDDASPSDAEALEVLYTPGHTPDSISLYFPLENRLFTGDLIYPGSIYLFLPGSSLDEFEESLQRLGQFIAGKPPGVVLGCGHITPTLPASRLLELDELLPAIREGRAAPRMARVAWSPEPVAVFQAPSFTLMCRAGDVQRP